MHNVCYCLPHLRIQHITGRIALPGAYINQGIVFNEVFTFFLNPKIEPPQVLLGRSVFQQCSFQIGVKVCVNRQNTLADICYTFYHIPECVPGYYFQVIS